MFHLKIAFAQYIFTEFSLRPEAMEGAFEVVEANSHRLIIISQ